MCKIEPPFMIKTAKKPRTEGNFLKRLQGISEMPVFS